MDISDNKEREAFERWAENKDWFNPTPASGRNIFYDTETQCAHEAWQARASQPRMGEAEIVDIMATGMCEWAVDGIEYGLDRGDGEDLARAAYGALLAAGVIRG